MKALRAIWSYIKSMNSEPGPNGGISIKRNSAWAILLLLLFVEVFSLIAMTAYHLSWGVEVKDFTDLCRFYAGLNVVFILLVLQITSVEKLVSAWQTIKGNSTPPSSSPDKEQTQP